MGGILRLTRVLLLENRHLHEQAVLCLRRLAHSMKPAGHRTFPRRFRRIFRVEDWPEEPVFPASFAIAENLPFVFHSRSFQETPESLRFKKIIVKKFSRTDNHHPEQSRHGRIRTSVTVWAIRGE